MSAQGLTDEQRWERARRLLPGHGDEQTDAFVRRRRRGWLGLIGGLLLVVLPPAAAIALSAHPARHRNAQEVAPHGWVRGAGFALLAVAVVLMVVGIVWMVRVVRSGVFRWRWNSPTAPLTRAQRRGLLLQIRGKRPVDLATLPVAQFLAWQLRSQLPPIAMLGLAMVSYLGSESLLQVREGELVVSTVLLCYLVVSAPLLLREMSRARRFLAAHPMRGTDD